MSDAPVQAGVVTEPVTIPARPSESFIATLRAVGASEGTVRRALGEPDPPRWPRLTRWLRRAR